MVILLILLTNHSCHVEVWRNHGKEGEKQRVLLVLSHVTLTVFMVVGRKMNTFVLPTFHKFN